jgi:hypothetical protein
MEKTFYDQFSDSSFRSVVKLVQEYPQVEDLVKTANMDEELNEKSADSAFAWRERRLFRIDSPGHALLSHVFIEKQAGVPAEVRSLCDKALELFGVKPDLTTKVAAADDTSDFLLPSVRRLMVKTATDVTLASDAIMRNHKQLDVNTRAEACTNLIKKAVDLNTPVPPMIMKLAGATMCDTKQLRDWIEARAAATTDPQLKFGYAKMAEEIGELPGLCGDRDELIKVAGALQEMDEAAGLTKYYDRQLPDPLMTVFNTDKVADDIVELAGRQVPMGRMLQIEPDVYKEAWGSDLAGEFIDKTGEVDPEQLKIILPTVPRDLQKALAAQMGI